MDISQYQRIQEIAEKQEELLRFAHFSNKDAWNLGQFLVGKMQEKQMELAVSIRKLNGYIVFQYASEKTSLNNQKWMQRKFNTVLFMECSSLKAWATSLLSGEDVSAHGLCTEDYVFCGGGFPVRLQTGEMVAVITASNLPHKQDHQFITESLSAWLSVENVPCV